MCSWYTWGPQASGVNRCSPSTAVVPGYQPRECPHLQRHEGAAGGTAWPEGGRGASAAGGHFPGGKVHEGRRLASVRGHAES